MKQLLVCVLSILVTELLNEFRRRALFSSLRLLEGHISSKGHRLCARF